MEPLVYTAAFPALHVSDPPVPQPVAARPAEAEATRGSAVKLAAESAGRVLGIAAALLIARGLGPGEFGAFAFFSGVAVLLAEAGDLGLQGTASRALVARSLSLSALVRPKLWLTGSALALACALPFLVPAASAALGGLFPDRAARLAAQAAQAPVLVPLLLYYLGVSWSEVLGVALRAFGRRGREAATILCFRATALGFVAGVFLLGGRLMTLAWALALSPVPSIVLGLWLLRSTPAPEVPAPEAQGSLSVIRLALPLGVNGALSLLSLRVEILAMGLLLGARAVGVYAAALKVIESLILVPAAISAGAMPALTQEAIRGAGPARARTAAACALLAVPAAVGLLLLAPGILRLAVGSSYAESALPLRILAPSLLAVFMNNLLLNALIARGRATLLPRLTFVRLLAAVLFALLLIPRLGPAGGALSFLLAESSLLPLAARACQSASFQVPVTGSLATAALVSLPMALALPFLGGSALAASAAGAAIYAATFLLSWRLFPRFKERLTGGSPFATGASS